MKEVISVDNMRASDAYTIKNKISGKELMYRAGLGVYRSAQWKEPVAVVCGSGNNAGDGYVIAKLLFDAGKKVTLIPVSEKFSEDGKYYFDICKEAGIPVSNFEPASESGTGTKLSEYGTIVDCLLGTGFKGQVREPVRPVIEAMNASGAYVVSVDINSGLNGDSGMADLCVRSDLTVSIGSYKTGLFLNMAKDVCREKVNCDIGIEPLERPYYLLEKEDLKEVFKERPNYSNKGSYGYIALIGGSAKYSGAIRLAYMANAAMRAGAGVVKVAAPGSICGAITSHILESTIYPLSDTGNGDSLNQEEKQASWGEILFNRDEIDGLIKNVKSVAFGMGIGTGDGAARTLEYLLENYRGNLIIDADGLTLLAGMKAELVRNSKACIVLTPHIKEFSRLTGMTIDEILEAPVKNAESYAKDRNVILLLKGPSTIITDGETTCITDRGCAGMATAGSGDVLSGILSAVCAYAGGPADENVKNTNISRRLFAVAAGAYINGRAGELAQQKTNSISMIASDTVSSIAEAISEIMG